MVVVFIRGHAYTGVRLSILLARRIVCHGVQLSVASTWYGDEEGR